MGASRYDVHRRLTRDRLGAAGVGETDKLAQESCVLVVVPVAEDDGKLLVVCMRFLLRVNDDGRTKSVHILAL